MTRHGPVIVKRISLLGLLAGVVAFAAPAIACPIPVYQYSLEWWERDAYEVYVFDNGSATEEQQTLIDRLERISAGDTEEVPANLQLRHIKESSRERLLAHSALRGQTPSAFPWMAVYYPAMSANVRTPVWMGELNADSLSALLDSPVRQRICDLLIERNSVVWLLLESGDEAADNEAAALIEREVKRLENTLVPPDASELGMDDLGITPIKFKTMRLSRKSAAERFLVDMLTKSEIDLVDYEDQPMLFPIFGRGLIMHALIGRGINPRMIRELAEFLTGPCSCTVKSLNPGTDLLTAVDWNSRVKPATEQFTGDTGSLGSFMDSVEDARTLEP